MNQIDNVNMIHLASISELVSCQTLPHLPQSSPSSLLNVLWVVSVQVVITEYHRSGGLYNKHLFLTVLLAGKSKIKV